MLKSASPLKVLLFIQMKTVSLNSLQGLIVKQSFLLINKVISLTLLRFQEVLKLAPVIVSALLLHYPALLIMKGTNGFVQGIGNALFGLVIALLDGVVFRICFSWFFGIRLDMGLYGMLLGYALATYGTAIPNLCYFLFWPWQRRGTVI